MYSGADTVGFNVPVRHTLRAVELPLFKIMFRPFGEFLKEALEPVYIYV